MLTKTTNVSGALKTSDGMFINISFSYRKDASELNTIDFNFNKDEVNVFGSYSVPLGKIANYSVNNGIIDDEVFAGVQELAARIAADPENPELYEPETVNA